MKKSFYKRVARLTMVAGITAALLAVNAGNNTTLQAQAAGIKKTGSQVVSGSSNPSGHVYTPPETLMPTAPAVPAVTPVPAPAPAPMPAPTPIPSPTPAPAPQPTPTPELLPATPAPESVPVTPPAPPAQPIPGGQELGQGIADAQELVQSAAPAPASTGGLGGSYAVKGTCSTDYSTSSSNRKTNIAIAAATFNKLILQPGQEVSVSATFKPRTAANGYKSAGVYSGGKTVSGIGGGICQVSSTIYNAAMNAGLTVTERHPHSMSVSYLPLGMDAAISSGSKDLRIRNDYGFPVMFETFANGSTLSVNVYTDEAVTAGKNFRLHSVKTGGRSADTYLEVSVNGQVVEDRLVGTSRYNPHG